MKASIETQLITIGEATLPIIEYRGRRVVTFAMVDQVHHRPEGTARKRFNDNKERFVAGEDFQLVDYSQMSELRTFGIEVPPRGLTLLTQSGYLMLVKSFTDDLAWKIQRELVNRYFQLPPAKSKAHELLRSVQLLVEQEERLQRVADEQHRQQEQINAIAKRQDDMDGDTGYMTALAFCRRENIPAPLVFAQKLGIQAAEMCRKLGIRMGSIPDERWGNVNSYPIAVLVECLANGKPKTATI
ncbi:MAG: ORF6N domain-containing protein [Magnetococcales bacterium]|nr:ORF6N domain-containing protein [Magnetococcales bacterium]